MVCYSSIRCIHVVSTMCGAHPRIQYTVTVAKQS